MTRAGMGVSAPALRPSEGRVDEDEVRTLALAKQRIDMLAVMLRDGLPKGERKQGCAARVPLVEEHPCTASLGMDREHARSGRGFKHKIGGLDPCGAGDEPGEAKRGRELLKIDLSLGPIALGRKLMAKGRTSGERACRVVPRDKAAPHVEHAQDLRHLERIIGVAHRPVAAGVRTADMRTHQAG